MQGQVKYVVWATLPVSHDYTLIEHTQKQDLKDTLTLFTINLAFYCSDKTCIYLHLIFTDYHLDIYIRTYAKCPFFFCFFSFSFVSPLMYSLMHTKDSNTCNSNCNIYIVCLEIIISSFARVKIL